MAAVTRASGTRRSRAVSSMKASSSEARSGGELVQRQGRAGGQLADVGRAASPVTTIAPSSSTVGRAPARVQRGDEALGRRGDDAHRLRRVAAR